MTLLEIKGDILLGETDICLNGITIQFYVLRVDCRIRLCNTLRGLQVA